MQQFLPIQRLDFRQTPYEDFATEILWLIQRYIIVLPKKNLENCNPNNNHQTLHLPTLDKLIEAYQITQSYYSSPLTCPTQLTQYISPHNRDIFFDWSGIAKSFKWMGTGVGHPTYHKFST